jgi:hypothetical protein
VFYPSHCKPTTWFKFCSGTSSVHHQLHQPECTIIVGARASRDASSQRIVNSKPWQLLHHLGGYLAPARPGRGRGREHGPPPRSPGPKRRVPSTSVAQPTPQPRCLASTPQCLAVFGIMIPGQTQCQSVHCASLARNALCSRPGSTPRCGSGATHLDNYEPQPLPVAAVPRCCRAYTTTRSAFESEWSPRPAGPRRAVQVDGRGHG